MIKNTPSRPLAYRETDNCPHSYADILDTPQTAFKKLFDQLMKKYRRLQAENFKLRATLMDYADTDWQTLSTIDRGKRARQALKEAK